MANLEDILWPLQKQSRNLDSVLADAQQVWRDENARAARQRYLELRALAESEVVQTLGQQHAALNLADVECARAREFHRQAEEESRLARQKAEEAARLIDAARNLSSQALAESQRARAISRDAAAQIQQANQAGE